MRVSHQVEAKWNALLLHSSRLSAFEFESISMRAQKAQNGSIDTIDLDFVHYSAPIAKLKNWCCFEFWIATPVMCVAEKSWFFILKYTARSVCIAVKSSAFLARFLNHRHPIAFPSLFPSRADIFEFRQQQTECRLSKIGLPTPFDKISSRAMSQNAGHLSNRIFLNLI